MNLVGKIFTVLILSLSILFLGFSIVLFQTHRNWRDEAIANKKKIEELAQTNRNLQNEIQIAKDRLQTETVARRFAIAALQSKYDAAESKLSTREKEYATLLAQNGTMSTQIDATSQQVAAVLDQNTKLRVDLRDAQQNRDMSFDRVIQLTDLLNQTQGEMQVLQERRDQLLASNSRMKNVLLKHNLDEFTPADDRAPTVDGIVTAVGEKDLLEISIGGDDGLKKGHTLEVYRNNTYLGRVMVRETWPDRAVVQIIPEFRRGIIKKGDRVATNLG